MGCYYNAVWAKYNGITQHPEWYNHFPRLSVNSSLSDFQYALHTKLVHNKIGKGNGTGWQCPMPCTSTYITTSTSTVPATTMAEKVFTDAPEASTSFTTTTTPMEASSTVPFWCWLLLILLGALLIVAGMAIRSFASRKDKRTPKKIKRAVDI